MSSRRYGELCPIARSADLLGERWTVLIIRELMLGPKRYSELLERLPAMGTNRLSDRLATLCDAGVTEKRGAGRTSGYALTEWGEGLRPILFEIIRWGFPLMSHHDEGDSARAEIITLGLTALVTAVDDSGPETYAFDIADECFHVTLNAGTYQAHSGPAVAPVSARITGTLGEFLQTVAGERDELSITADPDTADRVARLLHATATHSADAQS